MKLICLTLSSVLWASALFAQGNILTVVEEMPVFPNCKNIPTESERRVCSQKELLSYIYSNIQYPDSARKKDIQGLVVISFVVNEEGKVEQFKILKDIGEGCGDAAIKVIENMNKLEMIWQPGRQEGKIVKVKYNIPVKFKINKVPPAIEEIEKDELLEEMTFKTVDVMPIVVGCESETGDKSRKRCSELKLLKSLYSNLEYPTEARENGIEGLVVVTFVINKKGEVEQAAILKDIGGGCGEEVLRLINSMNSKGVKWIPGKQEGQPVKVRYNLPMRFKLP